MMRNSNDAEERRCRACSSTKLMVDWAAGDRVCTECGVVDEQHLLDNRAEWREFGDAEDLIRNGFSSGRARCGLTATNERMWLGGLQPTSLSTYVFGGPTRTSTQTRKKLIQANQRLDRKMEKLHAKHVESAKLSLQIRKRRWQESGGNGAGYDDDDQDDFDDNVRPELEQLLVQEEDDALAATAVLYAEKWSLRRAIRLYGSPEEQTGTTAEEDEEDVESLRNRLDATLRLASKDLYTAYSLLTSAARRLELPEKVMNEATSTLCQFAARQDGLTVKGVASQLKKLKPKAQPQTQNQQQKQASSAAESHAREALREYNKLKQMGALAAALLFYTGRHLGWQRGLAEVCSNVQATENVRGNPHLDIGKDQFIKMKHCSKAMAEIKKLFPELRRTVLSAPSEEITPSSPSSAAPENVLPSTVALQNWSEHMTRKLRLPPVAEASIRTLLTRHQHELLKDADTSKKRSTACAALTLFVCQAGALMQKLAEQASSTSRRGVKKRRISLDKKSSPPESCSSSELTDEDSLAEQRAYEMRRVWDAWREQTPWTRSLLELEQSCGVSRGAFLEFFQTRLFPLRNKLLGYLAGEAAPTAASKMPSAVLSSTLRDTPLATVLLPHITIAEPLMKETVR